MLVSKFKLIPDLSKASTLGPVLMLKCEHTVADPGFGQRGVPKIFSEIFSKRSEVRRASGASYIILAGVQGLP